MIDFIVIGLPRSGTAWLSVWLDATHDPFGKMLPEQFSGGLVCTGSFLMPRWLNEQRCPIAKITRDATARDASAKRVGLPPSPPVWEQRFADAPGRAWRFEDLWDEARARTLWEFLKNTPFDSARYRRLRDMRIEVCDVWKHDADVMRELMRRGSFAP